MAFEQAVAVGDQPRACTLLAPATRRQLEQDARQSCPQALGSEQLPPAGSLRDVRAYGRQAMARMSGDTLFLSLFPDGWKVVAAGCTPQSDRPYQCLVKGG
ncbi:hypothetical protein ACWEPM_34380 [Streptomyces sp. NPDC004244]|uniref:hypothetical protein n=1 Tax=Streptomyces sp. NPDC101206 TaxID=3366128 RepID=UPI0038218A28